MILGGGIQFTYRSYSYFSKFFGDVVPKCVDRCDVCKSPKLVEQALAGFFSSKAFHRGFVSVPVKARKILFFLLLTSSLSLSWNRIFLS